MRTALFRTSCLVSGTLALCALHGIVSQAHAYNVERTAAGWPLRFAVSPVSVYLVARTAEGVPLERQEQTLLRAIDAWNDASADGALLRYGGLVRDWPGHDLAVALDDNFVLRSGEFLGRVQIGRSAQGSLHRAEVSVNSNDFDFAGGVFTAQGKSAFDLDVALTHLLGHALGLGHSRNPASAMFFLPILPGQSRPTQDDAAGLAFLYGEGAKGALCDACERDAQCAAGLCLAWPDGGAHCAAACATHDDCPLGWSCAAWSDGMACVPNDGHCSSDAGGRPLGERCWSDLGCASGFCQSDGLSGYCTSACPCAGGSCAPSAIGSVCVDRGATPLYGRCWSGSECASGFCVPAQGGGGWCAAPCATGCAPGERCDGDWCVPAAQEGPGGLAVGWPCATALDCASGQCADVGGRFARACTAQCQFSTDCPAGTGCTTSASNARCVAAPTAPFGIGQPCTTAGTCGSARVCDLGAQVAGYGVCRASCDPFSADATCAGGERCVGLGDGTGVCRPSLGGLGTEGTACGPDQPCRADLICAGPQPEAATCRPDCLISEGTGCSGEQTCLPVAVDAQTGVCGEADEQVGAWPASAASGSNWAARAVDAGDLVRASAARRGPDAPEADAAGCAAARGPSAAIGWFAAAASLLVAAVRRRVVRRSPQA